jgi:O-antigen/teichoic acid export membrane protein
LSEDLKSKFISGVLWSVGDKLLIQLGYLAATLYIAKSIGPESFGLVGMLTIFTLLSESIINNGFSQALVQKSSLLTEQDKSTMFWVNLMWGIVIYIALYLFAPIISRFYNEPALVNIARLLFLIVIVNSLTVVVRAQLLINVDFKSQTIINALATIFGSGIGVFLAIHGYGYWALVWLLLLKAFLQNIGLWVYSQWLPKFTFSLTAFRSFFRFGSNLMVAGLVATFVNNLYIALVGRYFNATSVGYFTQATNLTNFLSQVISSTLQGVTYPILTSIKDDRSRLISLYQKLIRITTFASLPSLVGFAAVADTFVPLFLGDEWISAVPIIQILCFARALTPISSINMNILNAVGRPDLFLKVDLCKLPITITTLLVSINYGIEAVAFALLVNVFISFFINAYFPGKMFGFGAWSQIKISKNYILSSFIMFSSIQFLVIDLLWLDLILSIIIGVAIYVMILVLLRDEMLKLVWVEMKAKILSQQG